MNKHRIIIIGGGLAGLTASIHLSQQNFEVILFEKDSFPQHKVCGEYVSNEVLPYFESLQLDISTLQAPKIDHLLFSIQSGKTVQAKLPLGGFGISRFKFDEWLYQHALKNGVKVIQETVEEVSFENEQFQLKTNTEEHYEADIVLGAYGKRANIDKKLNRGFIQQKSSWLAVKAHYAHLDFPDNLVSLHNFEGGYCGLSKTESGAVNVCYLTTYKSFKRYKNPIDFKENVLLKNPCLNQFFKDSRPIFEKDISIAQISFAPKTIIENHILMLGDAAGLIHPLCGNGMAMAIHSAKIASEVILKNVTEGKLNRNQLEKDYLKAWKSQFKKRFQHGRILQKILLNPNLAKTAQKTIHAFPSLLPKIISKTHGKPFS